MHKICLAIVLLFPFISMADWTLKESDDGYWITSLTPEGHELVVVHNAENQTHFLLVLAVSRPVPDVPAKIRLTIDRGPLIQTTLTLLEQRLSDRLFRIELESEQKSQLVSRMIAGLNLRIWFDERASASNWLEFSLMGFTAAFNDLLIAGRVGKLDPEWLIEQHREKELGCYYTANMFVTAMQERIKGYSAAQTRQRMARSGHRDVDDMIPIIVSQVYAVPASRLPIEPMGDKYAIFDECMGP